MTSGPESPAATRPSHASHISGSYSVARWNASLAYSTSRSASMPLIARPSDSTPASNTRRASRVRSLMCVPVCCAPGRAPVVVASAGGSEPRELLRDRPGHFDVGLERRRFEQLDVHLAAFGQVG